MSAELVIPLRLWLAVRWIPNGTFDKLVLYILVIHLFGKYCGHKNKCFAICGKYFPHSHHPWHSTS